MTEADIIVLKNILAKVDPAGKGDYTLSNQEKYTLARFNWLAEQSEANRLELVKLAFKLNMEPAELSNLCRLYYRIVSEQAL